MSAQPKFQGPVRRAPHGAAMILVVLAMTVGLTLGVTFLLTATTTTRITTLVEDHTQARQIADAGIQVAIAYIEQNPDWITDQEPGIWVLEEPLLEGTVTIQAEYDDSASFIDLAINNASFEQTTGQLANPLFGPPMAGTIGGWSVSRTGLLAPLTGLTVPHVGISNSLLATDGNRVAYTLFPTSILGSTSFKQTLSITPQADANYALSIDAGQYNILGILAQFELQVWSGATLLGSSADTTMLTILDLGGDVNRYTVRFETDSTPPTDPLRIEIHVSSLLGLLSSVFFDNIEMQIEVNVPIIFRATSAFGSATHHTTAIVVPQGTGNPARVIAWHDK